MPSRRELLSSGSALLTAAALAGCNADTDLLGTPTDTPTETPLPYPYLRREPLHLGPDFDLELPADVTLVDDPAEATLTVLDSETSVDPARVVGWLEEGFAVAVLGAPAGETMGRLLDEGNADTPEDASYMAGGDTLTVMAIDPVPGDWRTATGYSGVRGRQARLRELEYVVEFAAEGPSE